MNTTICLFVCYLYSIEAIIEPVASVTPNAAHTVLWRKTVATAKPMLQLKHIHTAFVFVFAISIKSPLVIKAYE